jgi:legumain
MKVIILLGVLLCLASAKQWAVLVAGSNTYSNYRHQADVFHAYQTLTKNGFDKENIITLAYDDIANAASNPYKGKVFNKPSYANPGVDVYAGIQIDYKGADVTPENFLAVLEGNETATKGKKVLKPTPDDKVFIFFSDHGAPGLIAFPSKYLYADQLIQTFNKITGKFDKLVFYLEVFLALYRPVNLAQCSKSSPQAPKSMPFLPPTQLSLHGEHTATLMMWCRENISIHALVTFSV